MSLYESVKLTHLVVEWSAVRNYYDIETSSKMRGISHFLFVKLDQQRRTQTMQNQPTGYVDQAASHLLGPRGQLGWGGLGLLTSAILVGLAKNSDIGQKCKTSPQGTSIKRPAIYWDHAVSWGGGVWVC